MKNQRIIHKNKKTFEWKGENQLNKENHQIKIRKDKEKQSKTI